MPTSDNIRIFSQKEIFDRMPSKIKIANELLNMDREDDVIAILRYFNWN
jgi:ariadne-1